MDNIFQDDEYIGEGCNIPEGNLEYWHITDPDSYKKISEGIYRKQMIGNHGVSRQEILDKLEEMKQKDREETEKSLLIWNERGGGI